MFITFDDNTGIAPIQGLIGLVKSKFTDKGITFSSLYVQADQDHAGWKNSELVLKSISPDPDGSGNQAILLHDELPEDVHTWLHSLVPPTQ